MALFKKKEPYEYNVLERYRIDIDKTNRLFREGKSKGESWRGREYCDLVAENGHYRFYDYRTYEDKSGGYILRQDKQAPKNVVFFGESKMFNCVFHDYLFQVNRSGEIGRFGITSRNVATGICYKYKWLSEKANYVVINGYGRFYSQDTVKAVFVKDDKLHFKVSRRKSNDPHHKDEKPDKYDIDMEYELVVEYAAGKFNGKYVYPIIKESILEQTPAEKPIETADKEVQQETVKQEANQSTFGRDESKRLCCNYVGHEKDCPDDCRKCAIPIKVAGDRLLSQRDYDKAIRQYKKAVFVEPKFAEAWVGLGDAYSKKAEHNNALSAFDKAIAIDPIYGKAMFGKAITLRNLGKLDEAMVLVNKILEQYNDPSVKHFKEILQGTGIKDRCVILNEEQAKIALKGKAGEVIWDSNLLDKDGETLVIKEIFQPEAFSASVLAYCKKQYVSLGEKKVRGECIITSFYGAICAVLLYKEDSAGLTSMPVFEYLKDRIDLEFVGDQAEQLLGTKAEEERAEKVWGIISSYLDLSQFIFNNIDALSDEIILEAMKQAYIIGMAVGVRENNVADKQTPEYVDSLFKIDSSFVGKYIQVVGQYSWTYIKKNPLKCNLVEYSNRGTASILIELTEPLPDYITDTRYSKRYPIVLRGILQENSKDGFDEYVLKEAVYYAYWRDQNGDVVCSPETCNYPCNSDCPIYLNRMGEEQYQQGDLQKAKELLDKALQIAPYYYDLWCNLGIIYMKEKKFEDAYEAFFEGNTLQANREECLAGLIVSLANIGKVYDAQNYLTVYRNHYSEKNADEMQQIINNCRNKVPDIKQMTDEECVQLFDKDYNMFWDRILKEKESTFISMPCKYEGAFYRRRCSHLKGMAAMLARGKGEGLLRLRQVLVDDNVPNASEMCMFDVIDEYEKRYIKY